jgi:branched-chain amino acid transport system ATP-binding protein
MLILKDINVYYGQSHILQGVNIHVMKGECLALLGANGTGKTTTIESIMGISPKINGSIYLEEKDITTLSPWSRARCGIGYVPEDRGIFEGLTTIDNLKIPFLNTRKNDKKTWKDWIDYIETLFPRLLERKNHLAGNLSGGEQQMISVARGLISGTKMLLLDEPFKGLAPIVIKDIINAIEKVKQNGITILLVEEKLKIASEIADRFYFLNKGKVIAEETSDSLMKNPNLFRQLLGLQSNNNSVQ